MAFNGSGVFQRLYSWVNDAAANIKIRADRMDNEMNGFATGLSTCITKDGQTTVTANLPMANFRHTGTGAGASRTDYTRLDQAQDGKLAWVDGGGTADAITASYAIPITTLVDGQLCYVRATAANTTTTPTFSPSALTARTIVKQGGSALVAGDIAADGHELILRYDLANTRWELMNPKIPAAIPFTPASASTSAYLDFAEDTDNGTNRARVIAPATLAADADITLPGVTGTLSTLAGTETLTKKTIQTATLQDSTVTFVDNADATKQLAFECSGITTATTRTLTVPNLSGTIALAGNIITLDTPKASTSGTTIDFTGIPAGVKRVTINFSGVSTNGSDTLLIQLGDSGGIEATGYLGAGVQLDAGSMATINYTTGFGIPNPSGAAASVRHGSIILSLENSSAFRWCASGLLGYSNSANATMIAGAKALSAELDRVRITTVSGANTFDAGEINISYE
jgi:hypothetical protein